MFAQIYAHKAISGKLLAHKALHIVLEITHHMVHILAHKAFILVEEMKN